MATSMATAALADASANATRGPIRRINIVAGMVLAATATTIIDIGKVAKASLLVNWAPIMPPNMTITMDPDVEIN